MTLYAAPICKGCAHFRRDGLPTTASMAGKAALPTGFCDAFPVDAGIPLTIWQSAVDHRESFDGDRGIRYQPKTAADAGYAETLFAPYEPPEEDETEDNEETQAP